MIRARAFAPASVANVAVGFDLLGFSLDVTGDRVLVEKTAKPVVTIATITGGVDGLPTDCRRNTATAGLVRLIEDLSLSFGFRVSIEKGIPMGSGLGGSAASAVAAVVAANALLETPLEKSRLMSYALLGESQASGGFHADNIAPSLFGGLTLSRVRTGAVGSLPHVEVTQIPLPKDIHCVAIHPEMQVRTADARTLLAEGVTLRNHIDQSANLAGFITGCFQNNFSLIARSLHDLVIEPQRAHLIPGFLKVKAAALAHGALGCSLSGSGPSVFAWVEGINNCELIKDKMAEEFRAHGLQSTAWIVPLNSQGARLIG